MPGWTFRLGRRRSPETTRHKDALLDSSARVRTALDADSGADWRARPGAPHADDRPTPTPVARDDAPSRFLLDDWLGQYCNLEPGQHSALLASAFAMLGEAKNSIVQAREQVEAIGLQATREREALEHRLREAVEERRSLVACWGAERGEFDAALAAAEARARELDRELAAERETLRDAVAEAHRANSARRTFKDELQEESLRLLRLQNSCVEMRHSLHEARGVAQGLRASLAENTAEFERSQDHGDRTRGRMEAAEGSLSEARRDLNRMQHDSDNERAHQTEALKRLHTQFETSQARCAALERALELVRVSENRSGADALTPVDPQLSLDALRASLAETRSAPCAAPLIDAPAHIPGTQTERVLAMLRLDGVGHLHGCIEPAELPDLVAALHDVGWIAVHRVSMAQADGGPTLSNVGMPMAEFMFGVLPSYVLDVAIGWGAADKAGNSEDAWRVQQQLVKLLEFNDILSRLAQHGIDLGVVRAGNECNEFASADSPTIDGIDEDPLAKLSSIYANVAALDDDTDGLAHESPNRLLAALAPGTWSTLDRVPVDPLVRTKLLYLIARTVYSFQLCIVEAFQRAQVHCQTK
jgi:hypothetical protein